MKNIKKPIHMLFILGLSMPSSIHVQGLESANMLQEQELSNARQVDPVVDVAAQGEHNQADRLTEVEVSTPLVYLKMLSDDPITQAIVGTLGAIGLIVIVHKLYVASAE